MARQNRAADGSESARSQGCNETGLCRHRAKERSGGDRGRCEERCPVLGRGRKAVLPLKGWKLLEQLHTTGMLTSSRPSKIGNKNRGCGGIEDIEQAHG
jgi:hypothetical protein